MAGLFRRPARDAAALSLTEALPQPGALGDAGQTYVAATAGTSRSAAIARRLRVLEYNYELYERRGVEIYDRMRRSDPKIAGLLRAVRLPIIGAAARIEPVDPEDDRAVEVADFVSANLMHGLADSWRATLAQFLLYLCHGFAAFEIVWRLEDGKALIERFAYRPPTTIATNDIFVVDGRIDHVHQVTDTGVSADIPGEKLLWFVHDREGEDWRGTSLLRPMFKPWFAKEKLEILLLIAAERGNGIPVVTAPPGGWGLDENGNSLASSVDAALAAFCQSETSYFDLPEGTTFSLVSTNASIAELKGLRDGFDQDMSNVAIAQVLDLGKTETGSRALGNTLSDMFSDSLTAVACDIEDTMNAPGGPIEQLVAYNFAGAEDLVPRLRFGSLSKLDLRTFAAGLFQCWQMGMPFGDETWEFIRSELDLPALKEEAPSAQSSADAGGDQTAPGAVPVADSSQPQAEGSPPAPTDPTELSLAKGTYWRPLTPLETYVALDEIGARLDNAKAVMRERTAGVRSKLVDELVRRAQDAIASGDRVKVASLAAAKPPMVDALAAAVRAVYADYFLAGQAQVRDELARQKAGTPLLEITGERAGATVSAADPPKAKGKDVAAVRETLAWIDEYAQTTARQIASTTQAAVSTQAMRGLLGGVTAAAMTELATRSSDEAALRAGMTVSQVMVAGRSAEALAQRAQIATAVYSAILDERTCAVCEERDGDETPDIEEASEWTPNAECEGTDERCRCLVIYEYEEGS